MNIFSIVSALFLTLISLALVRSLAPYEKNSKLKYVSLKSDFLSELLIPKGSGYIKVNDRKKISLFSLVFYILFAIVLLVLVVMLVLPDIPCEPFVAHFGKRGLINYTINTLNEKLIVLLPMIHFLIQFITYFSIGISKIIKSKTESRKSLFGLLTGYVMLAGLLVFFILELVL